jgi:phage shock protein A
MAINRLLSRVENLEDQLSLTITDMSAQYEASQRAVTAAMIDEKKIRLTWENEEKKAKEWEQRAVLAIEKGQDELAKQALLKEKEHLVLMAKTKKDWHLQREQTEKLKASLLTLREKVEKARRDYHLLVARIKSAEAQKSFSGTMGAAGEMNAVESFRQLAEKVERLEIEAQAEAEVVGVGAGDPDLEAQFAKLEDQWTGDVALAALKARIQKNRLIETVSTETL